MFHFDKLSYLFLNVSSACTPRCVLLGSSQKMGEGRGERRPQVKQLYLGHGIHGGQRANRFSYADRSSFFLLLPQVVSWSEPIMPWCLGSPGQTIGVGDSSDWTSGKPDEDQGAYLKAAVPGVTGRNRSAWRPPVLIRGWGWGWGNYGHGSGSCSEGWSQTCALQVTLRSQTVLVVRYYMVSHGSLVILVFWSAGASDFVF